MPDTRLRHVPAGAPASPWRGVYLSICAAVVLHVTVLGGIANRPEPHAAAGSEPSQKPWSQTLQVQLREAPVRQNSSSTRPSAPHLAAVVDVEPAHVELVPTQVGPLHHATLVAVSPPPMPLEGAERVSVAPEPSPEPAAGEAFEPGVLPFQERQGVAEHDDESDLIVAATAQADIASGRDRGQLEPRAFPTRIAAPFSFRYEMTRGQLSGRGQLDFTKPDAQHYEARLRGRVGGLTVLSWTSTGGFDAAGLAPERYVDQRLARSPVAANFQRDAGKITYSGSTQEFPLRPGAQDRLSWMIQLPAILDADHAKAHEGSRIPMAVTGAHADAEIDVFRSVGEETVQTALGAIPTQKWVREPRTPGDDNTVEVWLDPARNFLPVRARLSSSPNDTPLELLLESVGG